MKSNLVCSAGNKATLETMINKYFYSTSNTITDDNRIYNKVKDKYLEGYKVTFMRGRWRFELVD